MAKKSLADYVWMLQRAQVNLQESHRAVTNGNDVLDVAMAQTLTVKQFEIAIELLLKLVFKAAKRLPEQEAHATEMTWPQAFRLWSHMGLTRLPESMYNEWRKRRNLTAHTYRENIYEELIEPILTSFDEELTSVLRSIKPHLPDE